MEKFSQFRDKGTGISPFLPVTTPLTLPSRLAHTFLFLFRLPIFLCYSLTYFLLIDLLPLPVALRKIALWGMMAIPGIWWVDLQLDGVKRGTLADQPRDRFPHPGSVIAANFTSPIDAVYIAAIFDPVFTVSYPGTRKVLRVGLWGMVINALAPVALSPPPSAQLVDISDLLEQYPDRVIAVFPECGTTNGKGILPFSPSLAQTPSDVHIFPVSFRYSPSDVTTPIPRAWVKFLWSLLSQPMTSIRVRVAEGAVKPAVATTNGATSSKDGLRQRGGDDSELSPEEEKILNKTGEALARLGRVKRVGLTLQDKANFVKALSTKKR